MQTPRKAKICYGISTPLLPAHLAAERQIERRCWGLDHGRMDGWVDGSNGQNLTCSLVIILPQTKPAGVKLGCPWPSLALIWAKQEPAQPKLKSNLGVFGLNLGRIGPFSAPVANLGLTWAQVEVTWGPTWRNAGVFGCKLGLTFATCPV